MKEKSLPDQGRGVIVGKGIATELKVSGGQLRGRLIPESITPDLTTRVRHRGMEIDYIVPAAEINGGGSQFNNKKSFLAGFLDIANSYRQE